MFGEAVTNLDIAGALQIQLGGVRRRMSWREFILALRLHTAEEMQTIRFGLYWAKSARYLRLFALRRKQGAMISGGQFVAQLAKHFGLLTEERIQGLTVIASALLIINMVELVRLQIYEEIDDTWAWVALGPERHPDAAAGAPGSAEDAHVVDEGDHAVLTLVQAPPPPPAAARTMPQRMARLEEDVHEIRGALAEQREVIGAMAGDFSRFTVCAANGITQLLDST
ncbi:hypothetical protein Tco_0156109 [Tanacetum coccineum]